MACDQIPRGAVYAMDERIDKCGGSTARFLISTEPECWEPWTPRVGDFIRSTIFHTQDEREITEIDGLTVITGHGFFRFSHAPSNVEPVCGKAPRKEA